MSEQSRAAAAVLFRGTKFGNCLNLFARARRRVCEGVVAHKVRVGYDLSHCMTPNNKPKPIYEASMRLWLACRGCSVVSAAGCLSSPIHQSDARSGDISVKVIGIKSRLLISAITVTSGRFPQHKDFCAAAVVSRSFPEPVKQNSPLMEPHLGTNLHLFADVFQSDGLIDLLCISATLNIVSRKIKSQMSRLPPRSCVLYGCV